MKIREYRKRNDICMARKQKKSSMNKHCHQKACVWMNVSGPQFMFNDA